MMLFVGYELTVANNIQTSPDDEFVPFRRSDAVLNPSNAQDVSPMSREHTQAALAREAYIKSMQPAQYGVHMHNIRDTHQPVSKPAASSHSKVLLILTFVAFFVTYSANICSCSRVLKLNVFASLFFSRMIIRSFSFAKLKTFISIG